MIPFSPPRIDEVTIKAVTETLKSGWITTGPKVSLFEDKINDYTGAKATVCVNSATAGLEIILRWFGVGKGDEVIIPAYTYCATANVVIHCGAVPVMVDANEHDFNISIQNIKSAITKRTKVIIPVDIAGFPCDYDEIYDIISSPVIKELYSPSNPIQEKLGRILLLADAAHSFGAEYKNRKSGSLADINVFSFHAVKNLTTAEGGAITLNLPEVFDNNELKKFLKVLGLHGQNKDALAKSSGNWKYDVICAGYKINMTDIQAAIGLVELERYDSETLKRRQEICEYYNDFFKDDKRFNIPVFKTKDKQSCYHLYMLRINNSDEETRNEIIKRIIDKGVAVNVHFQPLPLLTFYKECGYNINDYPKAYNAYKAEISLPVYYNLNQKMLETITEAVISSVNEVIPK